MTKKIVSTCLLCLCVAVMCNAQKMGKFGADFGKKNVMGKEVRIPYTNVTNYYGYIKPGAAPDETREGKKFYYLYVWIPAVAPELGIRMISPIPKNMKASSKDFIGADYKANEAERSSYFDTWITLEKAQGVLKADDIMKGKSAQWNTLGSNDDSSEMPTQPSGNKYNSLMRVSSEVSNPTKALVVGLYRIGFTTYKVGEVEGGFLAQVGAPVKLPGVAIASSLEDLMKQIKK